MKRLLAALLAAALLLALLPGTALAATDIDGHWARDIFLYLDEKNVINPGQNGTAYTPDAVISRAEFMRYLNRALDLTKMADISRYTDVSTGAWYYDQVRIAVYYGYIEGTSATTIAPNQPLTREQAATIIARLHKSDPGDGAGLTFSDKASISAWALPYISEAAQMGYILGYPDGTFGPQKNITRAEIAQILYRFCGTLLDGAGPYTAKDLRGDGKNATISQPCTLSGVHLPGNLYITEGTGAGAVRLDDVRVDGKIVISGGTVSLHDVTAGQLIVASPTETPQVTLSGGTNFKETVVRTSARLVEGALDPGAGGFTDVLINGEGRAVLYLSGDILSVTGASESALHLLSGARVQTLSLGAATQVTGAGTVEHAAVWAPGCTFAALPLSYEVAAGLTAQAAGATISGSSSGRASISASVFDKNAAGTTGQYADLLLQLSSAAGELAAIGTDAGPWQEGVDYTRAGTRVTLKKETLAALPVGECAIRLTYASGAVETIRIQVTDSSQNSLDKTAVTYDKYAGGGIALHLTAPAGATIQAVEWDGQALQPGRDYVAANGRITLLDAFLRQCALGQAELTVRMSRGNHPALRVTVVDTTPAYDTVVQVLDGRGLGVAGASVSLGDVSAVTDGGGRAVLAVPAGEYTLRVSADGYAAASQSVTAGDRARTYTVTLEPVEGLSVAVTTAQGAPVAGAVVSAGGQSVTTGPDGRAFFSLKQGEYQLTVTCPGYAAYEQSIVLSGYQTCRVVLDAGDGVYAAVVRVVDGSGSAVSGAAVQVAGQTVTTTASGTAAFQLARGSYPVTVTRGEQRATGTLIVRQSGSLLVLTLA